MAIGALALCAVSPRGVAAAGLLRCQGADGRVVYTDDKSVCPEAKPYQPEGQVQSVEHPDSPENAARTTRASLRDHQEDARAAEARQWKERKSAKEEELRQVVAERDQLAGYVAFCNHGNNVFTRDQSGIKTKERCDELSNDLHALDARAAGIRDYLERDAVVDDLGEHGEHAEGEGEAQPGIALRAPALRDLSLRPRLRHRARILTQRHELPR